MFKKIVNSVAMISCIGFAASACAANQSAPQVMMQSTPQSAAQQAYLSQQQKQIVAGKKVFLAKTDAFLRNPNTPTQNNKGKVTLVEFFDYQCSACHMMYPVIEALIKANPNLRIVYKDLPIFGKASIYAAKGSFAAYQQSPQLYLKYHDALFTSSKMEGQLQNADVNAMAAQAGLNMAKFHQAIQSTLVSQKLQNSVALAQALQLLGTPALIVAPTNATANTSANRVTFIPGGASQAQLQAAIAQAK